MATDWTILPNPLHLPSAEEARMEIVMMLVSLPLMIFGSFVLDAFSPRDDDKDDEEDDRHQRQPPDSGLPPII